MTLVVVNCNMFNVSLFSLISSTANNILYMYSILVNLLSLNFSETLHVVQYMGTYTQRSLKFPIHAPDPASHVIIHGYLFLLQHH